MSGMPEDADQRTIEPSQRRLDDFKKRGEIALSKDLAHTAALLAGMVAIAATGSQAAIACRDLMIGILGDPHASIGTSFELALHTLAKAALPILGAAAAGFLVSAAVQLGWPPTLKSISFDLTKVFSFGALGEMFSPRAFAGRLGNSFLRMALAMGAGAMALVPEIQRLAAEPVMDAPTLIVRFASAAGRIAQVTGGLMAVLAAYDYLSTRRVMKARMRMTPDEAKRDYREQEGDPHVKRKRRQRMRELAKRRLVSSVQGADVVLVNPTEYAVALRYRKDEGRAPKVVAKGRGPVAERIREIARKAGIPIVAQPPLARALHKVVREGTEIPGSLFHAVAEVLAYVYRLRKRRA
jgi:flagellar biosynthetic protein FlhB